MITGFGCAVTVFDILHKTVTPFSGQNGNAFVYFDNKDCYLLQRKILKNYCKIL